MAKGSTRKGMMMIGSTPGQRVKQLEIRMRKANGRQRSRLVEVPIKEPVLETPLNPSPSSSPTKQSRSPSKRQFLSADGVDNVFDMNYPPVEPMRLPRTKMQNDYILRMATPEGGLFTNPTGLGSPSIATYMQDLWKGWGLQVPRLVQQWTGDFFEDSALHMTGLQLHLGHDGAPCPSASASVQATVGTPSQPAGFDEDEWEDIDYIPLHLRPPVGSKYLTVIDVTGVHFVLSRPCQCMNAESYHKQLLRAKLYPSTFDKPSTVFTFLVLDDFLRDNVECGTSGMNYYSKLRRVTSSVFPHLVPDRYRELLRVARQWRLLKLLKWSGYQGNSNHSTKGDLALFCAACPQPGINLSPQDNLDDWRYTRTVVMDGNFKAEHMHERRPHDQVWLMDGHGFMVTNPRYRQYIAATPHITEKSTCNNHKAISQASASHGKLNSTGVGATACARHGCFYPHSVVDFQKGERQLNMDYSLCNALSYNMNGIRNVICFYDVNCTYMKNLQRRVDNSTFLEIAPSLRIVVGIGMWHVHGHKKECYARYSPLFIRGSGWVDGEIIETLWSTLNIVSASTRGMTSPHRQELLDFQMNDSNFMKMIRMIYRRKLKVARAAVTLAREAFDRLNEAVPSSQQENWWRQEEAALKDQPPTVHGVELHLLQTSTASGMHHGAASWLTRGLVIEEAEVTLAISQKAIGPNPSDLKRLVIARRADRVAAERKTFIADGRIYLQMDTTLDDSEECDRNHEEACQNILVEDDISSNGRCRTIGIHRLAEMELELRIAQANDALHGLRLALADKAVIFRGVVRTAMIALGAKPELLARYQELQKSHLTTSTAAFTQGAHDHRASQLPWFWSIDIPRDTSSKSWLTEFSTIHLQKFTESTGSVLKQEKIVGKRRNLC
ncbi:hypothetical protein EV401DRAFT_1895031 [Pisolithus croceorrhizus]|nr:hypothetical protein EV401DRAFT_1895031 [Pisolithus croceorrhizus]